MIRIALLSVVLFLHGAVLAAPIIPAPPQVAAKAYLLMDARTGAVLVEENADLPLPPASLTKIMTSYVLAVELAAGRASNDDMVAISRNAWSQNPLFEGSSLMWIEPGKDVSLEDLHRGVVISSGNDATVAIAEHLAGNESAFVDMMNGHAEALGMRDTWYLNSHGLPEPDHLTTARDLATLSRALIRNYPDTYALYEEREFTYNDIRQFNRNTLMAEDPSVDGIKTGHTEDAGYCLVASAERRGMRLISVVMGTASMNARKQESRSLLNYGFRFFDSIDLYAAGAELATPKLWKGAADQVRIGLADDLALTIPRGQEKNLESVVEVQDEIVAPISQGDVLGELQVVLDGEVLERAPLVALEPVAAGGFFKRLWHALLMLLLSLFQGG
jgi:D-alanyl-D-alanine carboxypeptidase (penicillin-binding protein 5/6)